MANPNIAQGNLNRLLASVTFADLPTYNVTPSYLMPEAIDIAFEGQSTAPLQTLTGVVNSPEPYLMARVTVHLVRAQAFANLWKQRWESNTLMGAFTVRPDVSTMDPYDFVSGSITNVERMSMAGRDAGTTLTLSAAYPINASMWP